MLGLNVGVDVGVAVEGLNEGYGVGTAVVGCGVGPAVGSRVVGLGEDGFGVLFLFRKVGFGVGLRRSDGLWLGKGVGWRGGTG